MICHENNYAHYELKDNVLYIIFKEALIISYEVARQLVQDRLRFQSFSLYNVICDVSQIKSIDSDARTYLSTYGSNLLKNVALVATNPTVYTMALFYVRINIPRVPTKIFKTFEEAQAFFKSL